MNDTFFRVFFLLALFLNSGSLFAQEKNIVSYNRFTRNEQNEPLFDTTNPHSFYSEVLHLADLFSGVYRYYNDYEHTGIKQETVDRLRTLHGGNWENVPGLKIHLGNQKTTPIANMYGEDSVIYLPDGTIEFLYPARDSIFFMTGLFDDFVIGETRSKEALPEPSEIMLRKVLFPGEEPVVVLSFDWKLLYTVEWEWFVKLPPKTADSLGKKLELFIAAGEQRFGEHASSEYVSKGWQKEFAREIYGVSTDDVEEFGIKLRQLRSTGKDNGVYEYPVTWPIHYIDQYGEDSAYYLPDGEIVYVMSDHFDTLVEVKKCFDSFYEYRKLSYDSMLDGWFERTECIVAGKATSPGEPELIVYTACSSMNSEYAPEQKPAHDYEKEQNPLRNYVKTIPGALYPLFDWELLIADPAFCGEVIQAPN